MEYTVKFQTEHWKEKIVQLQHRLQLSFEELSDFICSLKHFWYLCGAVPSQKGTHVQSK